MCCYLKSGNHKVRNWEILKNKLKPSIYTVQTIETMCFGLKSGNYINDSIQSTVQDMEIATNKVKSSY